MIGLNVGLLLQHDRLQVEFQVLVVLLALEVADDVVGREEVDVHLAEEAHPDFRLLLQDPQQLLVHFPLVLETRQQLHALFARKSDDQWSCVVLCNKLPAFVGFIEPLEDAKESWFERGILNEFGVALDDGFELGEELLAVDSGAVGEEFLKMVEHAHVEVPSDQVEVDYLQQLLRSGRVELLLYKGVARRVEGDLDLEHVGLG